MVPGEFESLYAFCVASLQKDGTDSDWNAELEDQARIAGIEEERILAARRDPVEAAIQRVEIWKFKESTQAAADREQSRPAEGAGEAFDDHGGSSSDTQAIHPPQDVGLGVVDKIIEFMELEQAWSMPVERGFAWWGDRLRQTVWATPGYEENGFFLHRVRIVSDVVKHVGKPQNEVEKLLGPLAAEAPLGSAMVFDPNERTVRLCTTGTVCAETVEWMARFLSCFASIQAIEAGNQAETLATMLDGEVDQTAHPVLGRRPVPDDLMFLFDSFFRPLGSMPSPWTGSDELEQLRTMLLELNSFNTGDEERLTAYYAFGTRISRLQVITTEQSPLVGSGVGVFLQLPIPGTVETASMIAAILNRAEARGQAPPYLVGSWCADTAGDLAVPMFATFLPAGLNKPQVLTSIVLSTEHRAIWVDELLDSEPDAAVFLDTLSRRFSDLTLPE